MRASLRLLLLGSFVPLASCMTSGTNMHGDFACRAPNGTCAPMSSIDAKAVAGMGASAQPVGGIADPAMPREGRVVTASTDGSPPGRTSDRVLRVVFPAHIDASGIYHDESTAHAVIEHGGWTDSLTGGARRTAEATQTAAVAQPAGPDGSATSKLASLDEVIAGKAASTRKSEGEAVAGSFPPTLAVSTSVVPRAAIMRSASAIDLREAAAAASAPPVAGLDPNFDTPDVAAVVADQTTSAAEHCTGYRPVWWHGHAYRRLRPVPCSTTVAAAGAISTPGGSVSAASSTRSLNLARLDSAAAPVVALGSTAPVSSPPSSTVPTPVVAPTASAPANKAVGYAPTTDANVAAARVSMLTRPIIADQIRLGRADAMAAAPPSIGQLLAGSGVTTSAVTGETPQ
ncbi:hypothetical protein KZX46_03155 (plasmid) [Polymorphobacter sp. PAMC 29334]|uniref:hypothetical protein n=1 Tax=Polymorphobacter sp. PAMC 29334 TaxID=2862331 RepID=UPI001C78A1AC|nr:hypothetical protein [Polymorphobacter sp. PAMC 29334]QYE33135.1 hypothetical protein KZX46_03155 [Polymorphobacter sp. PAMC 29334]